MNATAKRTMPLGLGIRVLSRLWLVHMRLRIARLFSLGRQNAAAVMGRVQ